MSTTRVVGWEVRGVPVPEAGRENFDGSILHGLESLLVRCSNLDFAALELRFQPTGVCVTPASLHQSLALTFASSAALAVPCMSWLRKTCWTC